MIGVHQEKGIVALVLAHVLGLAGCTAASDVSAGSDASGIKGGAMHSDAHPSVVYVVVDTGAEVMDASGVVIGPHLVLTAAHVVGTNPSAIVILPGHVPAEGEPIEGARNVSKAFVHPGYQPETTLRAAQHDLALLLTEGEPFAAHQIARIGDAALNASEYACNFELVGYGTPTDADGGVVRRAASNCIVPKGFKYTDVFRNNTEAIFKEASPELNSASEADLKLLWMRLGDGDVRTRDFVGLNNGYFPANVGASSLPSGHSCPGDSGGGIFDALSGDLVGVILQTIDSLDTCESPSSAPGEFAVTTAANIALYAKWIASVAEDSYTSDDQDCLVAQDHTCARKGVSNAPSCGFLAAEKFGWKLLHAAPASAYPIMGLSVDTPPPPLTSGMIKEYNPAVAFVNDQQVQSWHSQHGWRLRCDQSGELDLEGQPGWIRLDGYTSETGFPGSSPAPAGGTWDCHGCFMWRGD